MQVNVTEIEIQYVQCYRLSIGCIFDQMIINILRNTVAITEL